MRSILSNAVTLTFDVSGFPTMDDNPAKPVRKFRLHAYYMTNWIESFYCLHFDF